MTSTQLSLITQAKEFWAAGRALPENLFASLAYHGLDPAALAEKYRQ